MSGFPDKQRSPKRAQSASPGAGTRKRKTLTQEDVRERFDYDPETGVLRWKTLKKKCRSNIRVGDAVNDNVGSHGYKMVTLSSVCYLQHRVIWLWVYGYSPEHEIDHINRCRTDNRLCNLREATRRCNARNCTLSVNNSSGVSGVSWNTRREIWRAQVYSPPCHRVGVGESEDFVEAVALRLAAEQCLDWGSCDSASTAAKFMKDYLDRSHNEKNLG